MAACFALWAALAGTAPAHAQSGASFHGIGTLSGYTQSEANAVSGDGMTIVGSSFTTASAKQATRWPAAGGPVSLGFVSGASDRSSATGVSSNGSVIVGNITSPATLAFRWTAAGGMQSIDLGGSGQAPSANGISSAGDVVVGTRRLLDGHFEAVRWTAGGVQGLGVLSGAHSYGSGISGDGNVLVGAVQSTSPWLAFRWSSASGMSGLGTGPGGFGTGALDASLDGSVIVGWVIIAPGSKGIEPMRWTAATGPVSLGGPSGGMGLAVSGDGSVIVGSGFGAAGQMAFMWTQAQGVRDLASVLTTDFGLDLSGWTLQEARGISADGKTIVGVGINPQGLSEGWVARLPTDSDGDGLFDAWEIDGIPYTDSFGATQYYVLDVDGDGVSESDPRHKDLFIEVDAMSGFAPSSAVFTRVINAFAAAPVSNPDGAPGIRLHIKADEGTIPAAAWTLDDTDGNGQVDWPTEFDALKLNAASGTTLNGYFGTAIERNDPDGAGIRVAKSKAYRYCIFAQQIDVDGTSGISELPGNDFIVSLGLWSTPGGTSDQQAGTFMHELGHTLGLGHGGRDAITGPDHINFKPNYYSVMSYNWQTPKPWMTPGSWPLAGTRLGYSAFAIPTILDESAADDCLPALVVPGSALAGVAYPYNTHNDGGLAPVVATGRFDVASDWNGDGVNQCGGDAVPVDLTRVRPTHDPSPGQILHGRDDWATLVYKFTDLPAFNPGAHGDALGATGGELNYAEHVALSAIVPAFCIADVNKNRSVDVNDLLAVVTHWGACPGGCAADIAPIGAADGLVNVNDLLLVITHWGACP